MSDKVVKLTPPQLPGEAIDPGLVLNALGAAVIVINEDFQLLFANAAAEQLFAKSRHVLNSISLKNLLPSDSPVFQLIAQVQTGMSEVTEHGIQLDAPSTGHRLVSVQAAPVVEIAGAVVLNFQERSIADQIDHRLTHRDTARSVSAMAAMMAHEVKNPLSGIRGAAQLLEQSAAEQDRELTRLIQDEADRIRDLVDRMEIFTEGSLLHAGPVNIHQVLGRVRTIAQHGFASKVRFIEQYDPSLPPVKGDRDQLIQVFLNLVKNAAEMVPKNGGEIILKTAYQHGVRFAMPGSQSRVHLPLAITVQDNGPGIPDEIKSHLFEPFVSAKKSGSGLGLALVSKMVDDHNGVIDFESRPGRTLFRILLPVSDEPFDGDDQTQVEGN